METGSNRDIQKAEFYHQKSTRSRSRATPEMHSMKDSDKSTKGVVTILPVGNQKLLAEKHKVEKLVLTLLTVRTGLIAYHF